MAYSTKSQTSKVAEASNLMEVVTPYLMSRKAGAEGAISVGLHNMQPGSTLSSSPATTTTPAQPPPARHSNSTSTIYANSTVAHPDESEVMQSVASVLHCIMLQNAIPTAGMAPEIEPRLAMFDERSYTKKETRKRLRWGFNRTANDDEKDMSKRAFPDEEFLQSRKFIISSWLVLNVLRFLVNAPSSLSSYSIAC